MTIKILPNETGNPPGKLADAELHFTDLQVPCPRQGNVVWLKQEDRTMPIPTVHIVTSPLAGLKLIGFAVWERPAGRTVTFPSRQYNVNGERRSLALLRPVVDAQAQEVLRQMILEAYALHVKA